jgi:ATPase subunit of ABC transporter with duplicated ATPase domains
MLAIHDLTVRHPGGDYIFQQLQLSVSAHEKVALVGANGSGKSTLLKLITGEFHIDSGSITFADSGTTIYLVPQHFGQYDHLSVAALMGIQAKVDALRQILSGVGRLEDYHMLDEDWLIEDRAREALDSWDLTDVALQQPVSSLSGGQKTRVLLAATALHPVDLLLLDEPSNHLDQLGREKLYQLIENIHAAVLVVSHDRQLLQRINIIYELSPTGIKRYGGNYDFYSAQKEVELAAINARILDRQKTLTKVRTIARETMEQKQKMDVRGKRQKIKAGVPAIALNTLRNKAEQTGSKLKSVHTEKIAALQAELHQLQDKPSINTIRFDLHVPKQQGAKILFQLKRGQLFFTAKSVWTQPIDFELMRGERVAIQGRNGSGKSSLLRVIYGELAVESTLLKKSDFQSVYLDQEYSVIDNSLTVYEQMQYFNEAALAEHELKIRLNRFLFDHSSWDKPCRVLSGGEKMRLLLCGLMLRKLSPDVLLLDEPTNNLDLPNIELLTTVIADYTGTVVVVSHDLDFLAQIGIQRYVQL